MTGRGEGAHHNAILAVLCLGVAAFALLQAMVVPVLTTVQAELHTTQTGVTWVVTAYLLSASILTPIMGRIGDMVGKKRIFVLALGALAVGSLLAAIASSITVMIIARVIQGIGGGVLPIAFGIIRDEFPEQQVAGAIGNLASLTAAGGGLGIVLAGPVVDVFDYHWLFWLPMILTTVAAICAVKVVPESPVRAAGRISWLPAALLSAWLTALLVALSQGASWGWYSWRVLGLFGASIALAACWALAELGAVTPLIDMTLMRRPAVWTNNLIALFLGVAMFTAFVFVPEFVQTPASAGYGFGANITESGLMLLPCTAANAILGMNAGRLSRRIQGKVRVSVGCLIASAATAALAFTPEQAWQIYLATGLLGVGFGLAYAAMAALIVSGVPHTHTGVASGMNANIRSIGGSIGAAAMATIVTARLQPSGLPMKSGYMYGFAMTAGCLLLAAVTATLIPGSRRLPTPNSELQHAQLALVPGGTLAGDMSH